ncbi:hypothetical protein SmJEL517_g00813 [Synchytrium microbalum]|uniref:BAR domain-containing protein n=1 Tax=Synchytrium microbalum TaxID=1806994 RepID=A0A507C7Q0_9FUNG|nr:uncharacterized protein SmJEL517_g00813 [Synchytrium microbalum]TPX37077.1 hypothetical protein SmJEL517_g00813 [Synchytrium microbalum]
MSWSGFKKAVNRATTSVAQNLGAMEKTVDREYEEEERRYKVLETKVEKLHKEAKGYLDSVRAMTLAQTRIADTVDRFYEGVNGGMGYGALKYRETISKMDEEARTLLDSNYRAAVLDPLGRFVGVFPEVNEAVKRRQKKLLDYDRLRSGVRKLIEKPSDDASKLPRAEAEANQAREVYERLNGQLMEELPKLVDLRVPYLDPCFEALVKSQLAFSQDAHERLSALQQHMGQGQNVEGAVEGVLQQMRDLSICGGAV